VILIVCKGCGASVETYPSRAGTKKFCSTACALEKLHLLAKSRRGPRHQNWKRRVRRRCAGCRAIVTRRETEVWKYRLTFCSRSCHTKWWADKAAKRSGDKNPNWLGGSRDYRGPNWKQVRREVLIRDGLKCVECGRATGIVHHRKPFRLFDDYRKANAKANLEARCGSCHSKAEDRFWKLANGRRIEFPRAGVNCKKCGRLFQPRTSNHPERYCSGCRVFKPCEFCGTKIDVTSRQKAAHQVRFCSKRCLMKAVQPHKARAAVRRV